MVITILCYKRNRHGGGVVCFVRKDLSYNILSVFPSETENIFFDILLTYSKPIAVGTIYQSNFAEVLNNNMNKIDSVNNEIYILDDFNLNLYLNDSYFWTKRNILSSK